MPILSLEEAPLEVPRTVLVRLDYNVPLKEGEILDDTRLQASLPTLQYLLSKKAKVIILSHLGRPKGVTPSLSLKPLAKRLEEILQEPVAFSSYIDKKSVDAAWHQTPFAAVLCLENLRFWPGEESNDPLFSQELATLGELYVNDAFSVSHRAHASVEGITHYLPAYGGFHLKQEVQALETIFTHPQPPVGAVIGGSKVSSKFKVLSSLIGCVDHLMIAGGMANTFLMAQGYEVGSSFYEKDLVPAAKDLMALAQEKGCSLHLPCDVRVAKTLDSPSQIVEVNAIDEHDCAFDIGPKTLTHMHHIIQQCRTIVWNGPLGVFEKPPFDEGSIKLARLLADRTQQGLLYTLAGGGETLAALRQANIMDVFSYVSTAGGAFLEFMEGLPLPGLQPLMSSFERKL